MIYSQQEPLPFEQVESPKPISLSQPFVASLNSFIIDVDLLKWLYADKKIFGLMQYVYVALKIDYPRNSAPVIDIGKFCDKWGITELELDKAIVQLRSKDALERCEIQLELRLFDYGSDD